MRTNLAGEGLLGVRALGQALLVALLVAPPLLGAELELRWLWQQPGPGMGEKGLVVRDLDGDGLPEILATGCWGGCWILQSRIGSRYVETASSFDGAAIEALAVAGPSSWGAWSVVAAGGGGLQVHPTGSALPAASYDIGSATVRDLEVADVDADGQLEVVGVGSGGLWIRNLADGTLEAASPSTPGVALSIGQTDGDAALEIAVVSGSGTIRLLDGATLAEEWSEPALGGGDVLVVDLDGDGLAEVVSTDQGSPTDVRAFDPRTGEVRFDSTLPYTSLRRLATVDLDGDGNHPEIAVSDGYGGVHVLDGSDGSEIWSFSFPHYTLFQLASADVDDDGVADLVWSLGLSTYDHEIDVVNTATKAFERISRDLRGGFVSLGGGAVAGDARRELLATAYQHDELDFGPRLLRFRARDGRLLSNVVLDLPGEFPPRLVLGQADNDPALELFLVPDIGGAYSPESLTCLDGRTLATQWEIGLYPGYWYRALALGDVDGDGAPEVLVGGRYLSSSYLLAFEQSSGWLDWVTPDLGPGGLAPDLVDLADLDGDGSNDTVLTSVGSTLAVIDGATGASSVVPSQSFSALASLAIGGAAESVLASPAGTGELGVVDPLTGLFQPSYGDWGASVSRIALADVLDDPAPELIFIADQRLTVVDPTSLQILWQSPPLGAALVGARGFAAVDLDGDGQLEIAVDLGRGIAVFGRPYTGDVLLIDGFESGDVSGWSRARL